MPIRDVTSATSGSSSFTCATPDVEPGDRLIALQVSDAEDPASLLAPSGGDLQWTPLAALDSSGSFTNPEDPGDVEPYQMATRTWVATVSTAPSRLGFRQSSGADSVVIVASVSGASAATPRYATATAVNSEQITTPSVQAPSGGGTELRFATGTSAFGSSVSWTVGAGVTRYTSSGLQSSEWTAAVLGGRTVQSSGATGSVVFDAHWQLSFLHAVTILLPAGGAGGGQAPTPPSFPSFTPARGSGLYRYTVHDLLTGAYKTDIYPDNVQFDRKISEPGSFAATLHITNDDEAKAVAEVIPRQPTDTTTGPGPTVIHVWRAGELWGVYWLTGATVSRQRQQKPSVALRGSTLDAYLSSVELQEDLEYVAADQIDILRGLLNSMQGDDHANLGLTIPTGTSGVTRDKTYLDADKRTYGAAISDLAKTDDGFEFVVDPTIGDDGVLTRWLRWGAPTLGDDTTEHVFGDSPHGGDILDWSEEIRLGATRVRARGDALPSLDTSVPSLPNISDVYEADDYFTAGWPRLDTTIDRQGVTNTDDLDDYAVYWLSKAAGTIWVRSVTVALGAHPTFTPSKLGDKARFLLVDEWHPRVDGAASFDVSQRIIGVTIKPTGRGSGKEEATLILEGQVPT